MQRVGAASGAVVDSSSGASRAAVRGLAAVDERFRTLEAPTRATTRDQDGPAMNHSLVVGPNGVATGLVNEVTAQARIEEDEGSVARRDGGGKPEQLSNHRLARARSRPVVACEVAAKRGDGRDHGGGRELVGAAVEVLVPSELVRDRPHRVLRPSRALIAARRALAPPGQKVPTIGSR